MSDKTSDSSTLSADLPKLVSSTVLVFAGMLFGSFSKLFERILIGNWVTVEAYGEVSIGLALMNFAVSFAVLGFHQGVPRYIPRFEDARDMRGIWLSGLVIGCTLAVLTALLLWVNVDFIVANVFENADSSRLLALFLLCIPFIVGLKVTVSAIRGFENTLYRTYSQDLLYNGLRILVLLGLLMGGFGVFAAGYAYLASAVVAFFAAHLFLSRLMPLVGGVRTHARELVTFSTPLVVSTVITILLMETDTLMLGYFTNSTEVGLYGAAFPLAQGIPVVVGAFGYLYFPLASRLDESDDRTQIDTIYKLTTKWGFILMFPLFLTFVAFPDDLLTIVFRPEFARADLALAILATGFFVRGAFGRNGDTLSALGHPRYVLLANAVAYALNFALNLVLIPRFGFVGAAVTSALASLALNVVMNGVLRIKFGITPVSSWMVRTYLVLLGVLVPASIALSEVVTLSILTLPVFLLAVAFISIVLVALAGGFQPEDRIPLELIESALGVQIPLIRRFIPEH